MLDISRQVIGRLLVQYYLSLRMSAAAAMPEFNITELHEPVPIVRQFPGRMRGVWDEREVIHDGEQMWVITRDTGNEIQSTISWN